MIFFLYASRAVIADIRDYKHNKAACKVTLPISLGIERSKMAIFLFLMISVVVLYSCINSLLVLFPILLFSSAFIVYKNGYALHQLMILTTLFFCVNCIALFTNQHLIFLNLVYLGIWFNLLFYPKIARKSNPVFLETRSD
ncbi:hypothetical protein KKH43_05060 [Patescibacteria group bacterium]|nr:hypothetical protein [Patescibacteria group bacterium]